ncbi:MAG: MoaD/ThiS family protein [Salibacteraceae bacterium]
MNVKVLYFGEIAEMKGVSEEIKKVTTGLNSQEFMESLQAETPQLSSINFAIAINQEMNTVPQLLTDGCEVSVFPPFAGG